MTIVVTGGTKGIGLAIARRLTSPGEKLVLAYLSDDDAASRAKAELETAGASVTLARADIGDIDGAGLVAAAAAATGEAVSCLVHNAAMIYPTSLLEADLARFTRAVQVNGLSLLYLVSKIRPLLAEGSSIVFITSAGARQPSPRYGALGVAKALGESVMKYLVAELAPAGIRINAVAPGLVRTTSVARMVGGEDAAERLFERSARANPSGRMSGDADYADVVAFLASPAAAFVQGQVIHANGGSFVG